MRGPGLVSLVGAGPGDPELLTLRAVARLGAADVVFYDALVDRAALRHAPRARWAYVGKRAGRPSISQVTIERLMIRRAIRGERVVRLKSGDPFVFGRGGEEALALAAAGIPGGGRRSGALGHPGHPPRPLLGVPGRLGAC
jgi:siroheme synthase